MWCERHTSRRLLRGAWSLALLVAGILACVRLAAPQEWRQGLAIGAEVGAPLVVLLLLPAVSNFVKMLGWRALLPAPARPSLPSAYGAFVAAQAGNELGVSLLGEPLKVLVLPRRERAAGLLVVVADNLIAFAALFAVLGTLAPYSGPFIRTPRLGSAALAVAGAALVLLLLAVVVVARRSAWRQKLTLARELVLQRPGAVAFAFTAHYLGKLWLVVEIGLGLSLLGLPALAASAPLSFAWTSAATLGAAVPGQLGVVEAALVQGGASLGLNVPALLTLALVRRLRACVWLVLGLILAVRIATARPTEEAPHDPTPAS